MRSFVTFMLHCFYEGIMSRRMRWAGDIVYMGNMRNTKFWLENLKGKDNLEHFGIGGRILE